MDEHGAEDDHVKVLVQQLVQEVRAVLLTCHTCCCVSGDNTLLCAASMLNAG
jgi:hypothetical protein